MPADINKQYQAELWRRNASWRDSLYRRLCHQSLDIPEDGEMQANRTNIGITWKELAAVGAIGICGWWVAQQATNPETPPVVPAVQQAGPVDSEYDVIFYDSNGNKIDVPHISKKPTQ